MTKLTPADFANFFTYFKGEPHQLDAVDKLYFDMPSTLLQDDSKWVEMYRAGPPEPEAPEIENPLPVKYFWQQDNGPEGWRQCQTSSIAMCLNYLKVPGINDDIDYLKVVERYGDTTLQSSHQQALKSLGVPARFRTDGGKQDLINRVNAGLPCPIGILHHGNVSAPSGGGHYIVVIGYTETHAICHDPYGDLDLVSGTWAATGQQDGKSVNYSWKNLLPRWDLNNGTKDGWFWEIGEPGK